MLVLMVLMLADVPTVDGRRWKKERIAFLESLLRDDPDHEHRAAIEAELAELKASGSKLRWLFPGRLPHER
jgi:hypothetical protein